MATVTHVITTPDGAQPARVGVSIRLLATDGAGVGPAYITGNGEAIEGDLDFTTTSGTWSKELEPNANITPAGTVWRVIERVGGKAYTWTARVTADGDLSTMLVDPPTALATPGSQAYTDSALAAHIAAADPHPTYTTAAEVQAAAVGGELTGTIADARLTSTVSARYTKRVSPVRAAWSAARSSAAHATAAEFVERWADLTAWTANGVQVSAGLLYAGASPFGANHAFPVAAGQQARIEASIVITGDTANSLTLVGFSNQAAGATPDGNGIVAFGINGERQAVLYTSGDTGLTGNIVNTVDLVNYGTWYLTATLDVDTIGFALTDPTGLTERVGQVPRGSYNPNNILVWNSDPRGLSGHAVGPLAARKALVTAAAGAGIEGQAPYPTWLADSAGTHFWVALPASYDSRTATPLVIYAHGAGGNELSLFTDGDPYRATLQALLDGGYAIAASGQHGDNWGNQDAVDDLKRLYRWCIENYAIGPVLILGHSMGGLSSLTALATTAIPDVAGYAGIYPAVNLRAIYDIGTFTSAIKTQYGIAVDGSDYDTKTAGHDPALREGHEWAGIRFRLYASPADNVVPKATNSDLLELLAGPYSPEATVVVCSGEHGDPSHYQPADLVAFYDRCVAAS